MSIDTIIYEHKNGICKIAQMGQGRLCSYEQFKDEGICEGNIYLGQISGKTELANGRTGLFVEIGDTKPAFLNENEYGHEANLTVGQSVVVQVQQEARAEKGAKVVRSVQFVGQNICYCPFKTGVEVSSRLFHNEVAAEYKQKVWEHSAGQEGWILRTSSVDASLDDIFAEMDDLRQLYDDVRTKARTATAPALLYSKDNPIFDDIINCEESLQKVVLNDHHLEDEIKDIFDGDVATEFQPDPFASQGIEDMLAEALLPEVKLPSGGRLFIEETKACVAIDVDSGEDRGHGSISHLNEEAAREIAHQIRLRNLTGKIIIDFAGTSEYKFIKPVLDILHEELAKDKNKARLFGLSKAGNVEIIRVRRRPSLSQLLTQPCEHCQGTGRIQK
ncbi:MAG: ribonuclease E/G [Alphaproteobacteria bacterium]|nr:ribonuclease E/G [Alphaproteobacteria bacterium]